MNQGLYEELVTKLINLKINELDKETFHVKKTSIDKVEAAQLLSQHIGKTIKHAFSLIKGEDIIETQIEIANKIILFLKEELKKEEFEDDLIETEGKILKAGVPEELVKDEMVRKVYLGQNFELRRKKLAFQQ